MQTCKSQDYSITVSPLFNKISDSLGLYGYPARLNKAAFWLIDPKGAWSVTQYIVLADQAILLSGRITDLTKYSAEQAQANRNRCQYWGSLNMWILRGMRMIDSWEYIARAEERSCSNGYCMGKYIAGLYSIKMTTY